MRAAIYSRMSTDKQSADLSRWLLVWMLLGLTGCITGPMSFANLSVLRPGEELSD